MCDLLLAVLGTRGCSVHTVRNGRDALELIEKEPWDLVICDLRMPLLAGHELYERATVVRPGMEHRFLFITGEPTGHLDSEGLAMLENRLLPKPFKIARLLEACASIISQAGHSRQPPGGVPERR